MARMKSTIDRVSENFRFHLKNQLLRVTSEPAKIVISSPYRNDSSYDLEEPSNDACRVTTSPSMSKARVVANPLHSQPKRDAVEIGILRDELIQGMLNGWLQRLHVIVKKVLVLTLTSFVVAATILLLRATTICRACCTTLSTPSRGRQRELPLHYQGLEQVGMRPTQRQDFALDYHLGHVLLRLGRVPLDVSGGNVNNESK